MKRSINWFIELPLPLAMIVAGLTGFGVGTIVITLANVLRILAMIVGWGR